MKDWAVTLSLLIFGFRGGHLRIYSKLDLYKIAFSCREKERGEEGRVKQMMGVVVERTQARVLYAIS